MTKATQESEMLCVDERAMLKLTQLIGVLGAERCGVSFEQVWYLAQQDLAREEMDVDIAETLLGRPQTEQKEIVRIALCSLCQRGYLQTVAGTVPHIRDDEDGVPYFCEAIFVGEKVLQLS